MRRAIILKGNGSCEGEKPGAQSRNKKSWCGRGEKPRTAGIGRQKKGWNAAAIFSCWRTKRRQKSGRGERGKGVNAPPLTIGGKDCRKDPGRRRKKLTIDKGQGIEASPTRWGPRRVAEYEKKNLCVLYPKKKVKSKGKRLMTVPRSPNGRGLSRRKVKRQKATKGEGRLEKQGNSRSRTTIIIKIERISQERERGKAVAGRRRRSELKEGAFFSLGDAL